MGINKTGFPIAMKLFQHPKHFRLETVTSLILYIIIYSSPFALLLLLFLLFTALLLHRI